MSAALEQTADILQPFSVADLVMILSAMTTRGEEFRGRAYVCRRAGLDSSAASWDRGADHHERIVNTLAAVIERLEWEV